MKYSKTPAQRSLQLMTKNQNIVILFARFCSSLVQNVHGLYSVHPAGYTPDPAPPGNPGSGRYTCSLHNTKRTFVQEDILVVYLTNIEPLLQIRGLWDSVRSLLAENIFVFYGTWNKLKVGDEITQRVIGKMCIFSWKVFALVQSFILCEDYTIFLILFLSGVKPVSNSTESALPRIPPNRKDLGSTAWMSTLWCRQRKNATILANEKPQAVIYFF